MDSSIKGDREGVVRSCVGGMDCSDEKKKKTQPREFSHHVPEMWLLREIKHIHSLSPQKTNLHASSACFEKKEPGKTESRCCH